MPVESQIAVFSKTSLQSPLIGPNNPRTIFFNDSVAVGWMKGGFIEIAALDPRQGVQFYTLDPHASGHPRFEKGRDCLRCHVGEATLDVAGTLVRSTYTAADGSPMLIYGGSVVDRSHADRRPLGRMVRHGRAGHASQSGQCGDRTAGRSEGDGITPRQNDQRCRRR